MVAAVDVAAYHNVANLGHEAVGDEKIVYPPPHVLFAGAHAVAPPAVFDLVGVQAAVGVGEAAAEQLGFISEDRIYRIEKGALPDPDEVLTMAKCYQSSTLCNYYCANECKIGQEYVPEVKMKELSQITLEMLATLNSLNHDKERLIEITVDGVISDEEVSDFLSIQDSLEKMSLAVSALRLWVDQKISEGKISKSLLHNK